MPELATPPACGCRSRSSPSWALSMLAYVVLDGYDLGVGLLLRLASDGTHKDIMVASIGPFWDANETWLVLGSACCWWRSLLAHGVILGALSTAGGADAGRFDPARRVVRLPRQGARRAKGAGTACSDRC